MVLASSCQGNLVVDPFLGPFLGSGTTALVAEQLGRTWKGCDISVEYGLWAARRSELVPDWPVEKWMLSDQENAR